MVITFCGHSNYVSDSKDEERLLNYLETVLQGSYVEFYLGGYGGFDDFAFKCAKKYKRKHKNVKLVFITPYLGEWLNKRKDYIEERYDEIIYPDIENVPLRFAISKRNEWMIKKADYVVGYVKTHYGGAYKMLLYARKQKKQYINLYQGEYELY